jgi:hypothetical protein
MHVKSLAVLSPLLAGFLMAQQPQAQTTTTTSTTTWNGTLLDAGCRATHTETKETKSDQNGTKSTTTRTTNTDCPVATTTTAFGVLTSDGKFIRFDPSSNTRIGEMIRNSNKWNKEIGEHAPVTVRVLGKANGEMIVVESIE